MTDDYDIPDDPLGEDEDFPEMGEEDGPHYCHRCERDVEEVQPMGWAMVSLWSPSEGDMYRGLLCAICVMQTAEFVAPGLKSHPMWVSGTDQFKADIRDRGYRL